MRENDNSQMPLSPPWGSHQRGQELAKISEILDEHRELNEVVANDLRGGRTSKRGRRGMTGEQVLRVGMLYMLFELTYEELSFHLQDSSACRSFARLGLEQPVAVSTLKSNIKRVTPETWEVVNRAFLGTAKDKGVELGRVTRTDCSVVETNIHSPSDSSLLWDSVRVITRKLNELRDRFPAVDWTFHDHTRQAKKRALEIEFPPKGRGAKKQQREKLYRSLIKTTQAVVDYGRDALKEMPTIKPGDLRDVLFLGTAETELRKVLELTEKVIDQTIRRVVKGEKVPAEEKIFSIFETHTDIIIKKDREVLFGHKICLTGGKSGMILDLTVEDGNPADSTMVERTVDRQIEIYGRPPRQASFDGGFASRPNLEAAKAKGVEDTVFHKKCGLEVDEMAKSPWVFRKLKRFRAGIEGCISTLKRAFKMSRCSWRGKQGFHSYIWASVTSFNALTLARHLISAAA